MDRTAGAAFGFLLLLSLAANAQTEVQVKVIEIKGSADSRHAVDKPWKSLRVGDVLPQGAWIQTGLRSRVYVKFGDNTVVQIKSGTLLQIAEAGRTAGKMTGRLKLALGSIHVEVNKTSETVDFKVVTPQVTASVKGTGFDVRCYADSSRIDVQHGRVGSATRTSRRDVLPGGRLDSRVPDAADALALRRTVVLGYDGISNSSAPTVETLVVSSSQFAYDPSATTNSYVIQKTSEGATITRNQDGSISYTTSSLQVTQSTTGEVETQSVQTSEETVPLPPLQQVIAQP